MTVNWKESKTFLALICRHLNSHELKNIGKSPEFESQPILISVSTSKKYTSAPDILE